MRCLKKWWNKHLPEKIQIPKLPDFVSGEEIAAFETNIMLEIQKHRYNKGLKRLKPLVKLNRIATLHSIYQGLNKEASHNNFPKRSMLVKHETDAKAVKEIVAGSYGTVKGVIGKEEFYMIDEYNKRVPLEKGTGWLGSEEHRLTIEWKEATHYGISVEVGINGRKYYTVIFISK